MSKDSKSAPLLVDHQANRSFANEGRDLMRLAAPLFVSMVSWVGMNTTDSALLGHVYSREPSRYLSAAALSDLWTSSTGVLIQNSVLTVFCSQALGAGNKQLVGIWFQVALFVMALLAIPVIVLWMLTGPVLRAFGEPEYLANDSWYYAAVLSLCVPSRVAFSQISKFLSAQRITKPELLTSLLTLSLNITLGLMLVLGIGVPGWDGFGFAACPIVTMLLQWLQLFLLVGVFWFGQGLYKDCWPTKGWSFEHITCDRISEFVKLQLPATLSWASDYWRTSTVGAVAASFGAVDVGVFNASYRIIFLFFIFSGSVASSAGIKVGNALGAGSADDARFTVCVASTLMAILLSGSALVVWLLPRSLGMIFSADPAVLDLFEAIGPGLALTLLTYNMACFFEDLLAAMGRTQSLFWAGFVCSWGCQVPCVVLITRYLPGYQNLQGLYLGMALGYGALNLVLAPLVICTRWKQEAQAAQERSKM